MRSIRSVLGPLRKTLKICGSVLVRKVNVSCTSKDGIGSGVCVIKICLTFGFIIYMSKLHTFLLFFCGLEESLVRSAVSPKPSAANYVSPRRETYVQKLVESAHNH